MPLEIIAGVLFMNSTTMKSIPPDIFSRLLVIRRSRCKETAEKIAGVGFFIFFPGFLIYHLLIAATSLPPFLGGLFGYSAALFGVLLPLVSLPFFKNYLSTSPFYVGLFFIFIGYVLIWTVIHWTLVDSEEITAATIQSIETVVIWIAMFYVGMLLPRISFSFSALYSFLFLFMFGSLVLYVVASSEAMFYARHFFNVNEVASYQVLARSALGIIIISLVGQRTLAVRSAIIICGVVTLYILGARSELVGFLILAIVLLALFTLKDPRYFLYCIIGGLVFFLALLVLEIEIQSRQAELMNLASSRSWQTRMYLQDIAINQIVQSPILGIFGGHILDGGSISTYSHNVLSAWVNYGVVGFLLYIMLTTIATIASVYYIVNRSYSDDWLLSFCINFVSLVLIIGAKSAFWALPALGWGLYVRAWFRNKPSRLVMSRKDYTIVV
jgi:hypothetical protein